MPDPHPGWQDRVRASFARQRIMTTLGATIAELDPGRVVLAMPYTATFAQQHGFLHAGATATLADSACGYAAYTLAPPSFTVLTVEFKINLLAPARGTAFTAEGRLVKGGRTLSVCTGTVTALEGENATVVAQIQATVMLLEGADDRPRPPATSTGTASAAR